MPAATRPRRSLAPLVVLTLASLSLSLLRCGSSSSDNVDDSCSPGASGCPALAGSGGASGQGGGQGSGQSGAGQAGSAEGGAAGASGQGGAGASGSSGGGAAPYTLAPFDKTRITSNSAGPNFQKADAEIDLHDGPFSSVTLVVDLGTTCFPFESWKGNPPPSGQNFPADCDAFDRNFEITLDEPLADGDPPAIELMRAITPFGGPEHQEIDITDVANGLPGKHRIRVTIPTWSDGAGKVSGSNGGWNVTAQITATPGEAPRKVLAVKPLFNFSKGKDGQTLSAPFEVPEGTTSARIEYRATGHGGGLNNGKPFSGCIGPAEEFCKRKHTFTLDAQPLQQFVAWRSDCNQNCTVAHQPTSSGGFDYCTENPTGDMNSVKAPRANWCPGTLTPPLVLDDPLLAAPGTHDFAYKIATIEEGGSWRLSAVFFAFGP